MFCRRYVDPKKKAKPARPDESVPKPYSKLEGFGGPPPDFSAMRFKPGPAASVYANPSWCIIVTAVPLSLKE